MEAPASNLIFMIKQVLFLLLLCVQWLTFPVYGQFVFKGKVVSQDSIALQGVSISINNKILAISDAIGYFEFPYAADKATVRFSSIGYQASSSFFSTNIFQQVMLSRSNDVLEEAIIKSYEGNTALKNIPATVSVLSKADLDRYSNTSFIAAVNTVPGVKMDERSPGSYRLSIRGNLLRSPFGVRNVKVYWNGIPFTDANGNTYLNQIGFNNIGKMEILKGPAGSMYGAGTGGVVLLGSRNAAYEENSISINALAGSYGTIASDISYKNSSEKSTTNLAFSHQQSDGWRNHTSMRRDVASYTASFLISQKRTINTNVFYSDLYYQTPGGLTKRQMDSVANQSRPAAGTFKSAAAQQAAIYVKTFYAGLSQDYQFNSRWSNNTSIYTSATRFKNPSILNYQRKTEQGIGSRSVTQFKQNKLTLHIGGEYQYGFTSTRTFGNKLGVPDTLQFDDEIAATQYNLFVQTTIELPSNFSFTAGLSYNNYGYGFTRLNKLPATDINKIFDPVVVPRIALIKKWGDRYSAYTTISKGYSPPTIDEIVPSTGVFNGVLAAEKATNYEAGARGELIKDKLYAEAAFYLLYLRNTIVTRRDAAGADFFVNTGNTKQRGLELSVNYFPIRNGRHFLKELKLWSNYTSLQARFKTYQQGNNNFSGNKLTGTPPTVFVLGADVATSIGLYANLTYNYTDALPLNDANTFTANSYQLLFAKLGYKKMLGKKIQGELYMVFDQSFNTPYSLGNDLNAAGNRFFNPSASQNFTGGLKIQFNLQ
jgi:iron complex outermembrane receptor protein